jgi:hypothetical protein
MKKTILIIMFYVPLASANEVLTFDLSCKILEQSIVTLNEGKSEKYDQYKDDLKKGDTFFVNFLFEKTGKDIPLRLSIKSEWLQLSEIYSLKKNDDPDFFFIKLLPVMSFMGTEQIIGDSWVGSIGYDRIYFSQETLHRVEIDRYYLNDWELIYFDVFDGGGLMGKSGYQIVTANCMKMPKEYNEMITLIENIDE